MFCRESDADDVKEGIGPVTANQMVTSDHLLEKSSASQISGFPGLCQKFQLAHYVGAVWINISRFYIKYIEQQFSKNTESHQTPSL
jgi:hypothetical protein